MSTITTMIDTYVPQIDRDIDTTSSCTVFVLEEVRRLFLAIGVLLRIVYRACRALRSEKSRGMSGRKRKVTAKLRRALLMS